MRASALGRINALAVFVISAVAAGALFASVSRAETGGAGVLPPPPAGPTGGVGPSNPPTTPTPNGQISPDGLQAVPPAAAPPAVKNAIYAANKIAGKPYRYGGGHGRFNDTGYDCSGSISFALRGGRFLKRPLDSRAFASWGEAGKGQWVTVYTNPGHAYVMLAGMRFDTSGPGPRGPRWRKSPRSPRPYTARHPSGF